MMASLTEGKRRAEILDTASRLFATSGLRTSLQDIADACGIRPQSLYHHFQSKELIVVELISRYQSELDDVAKSAQSRLPGLDPALALERVADLGTAIAECAVRHSAAVQFTFYEPPAGAGGELLELAGQRPVSIELAVLDTLRLGRSGGALRADVDLPVLADRLCQTMLHVGLYLFHQYRSASQVARQLCRIMLHGVAVAAPSDADLDRSAALRAVDDVVAAWQESGNAGSDDRAELIRRTARSEFGRRGYEVTTMRDIAAAAGLSIGTVYRQFTSKEELLAAIMSSFHKKAMAGWAAVLGSGSGALEKLDALAWLHLNVVDTFNDEFKIQLTWLRQSPPDAGNPGFSFPAVLRQMRAILSEGARAGQIRVDKPTAELTSRCVLELTWVPERIVHGSGKRAALVHARDTILRGVASR